jgi:tetratricopeptide (TPR) repeat protein/O-antigen ligase
MPRKKRKKALLDPNALFISGGPWDSLTLVLLVLLLVFAPASFGAVEAWSELIVILLASALSLCVAIRALLDRDFRPAATWLYVPLVLFLLLVVGQLVPLPTPLVSMVSPATVSTKQEFLGSGFESSSATTLSFYPRDTVAHLRLVLIGTAVFLAVANMIRGTRQIKLLLLAIFAIGCTEALLAIAQIAGGSDKIYWQVPTGRSIVTSGSFINYSHFSQFMNLSLGAGIAFTLIQFREQRRNEVTGTSWQYSVAHFGWDKYGWLLCGMVLCAIAVLTSMSRNGAISMLVAASVVGAALSRQGFLDWKGWLLGAIPLAVFTVLLIVGFDVVYDRLATLQEKDAFDLRWEMTTATLRAWAQFPIWGAGLGTHAVVFPMFDTAVTPNIAVHADNDYAQLLEETGIAGALFVTAFLGGIAMYVIKLAVRGKSSVSAGVLGLAFGLVAVSIHSFSDFGQRIPANLILSAALCGLIVAIAIEEKEKRRAHRRAAVASLPQTFRVPRAAAIAGLVGTLGVWGWAIQDAYFAYLGEQWWSTAMTFEARVQNAADQASDDDYSNLIIATTEAFAAEPDNANYGYWLNSFRWDSLSRVVDPETGELLLHPDVLPFVGQIADELAGVRRICPTFGPPFALEGQLRLTVLKQPEGADLIRKAVRLASYDPPTCLVAGELAAQEGKLEEAERLLTRAVALQPGYFPEVIDIYLRKVKQPKMARRLAGDDYSRLEELARAYASHPEYAELVDGTRAQAMASLRQRATSSDANPYELAALARIELADGKVQPAIELYRRALVQDYRQVDWRLELARALADTDQIDTAIQEVRTCLRLRSQYAPAMQLMEDLVKRKDAIRE